LEQAELSQQAAPAEQLVRSEQAELSQQAALAEQVVRLEQAELSQQAALAEQVVRSEQAELSQQAALAEQVVRAEQAELSQQAAPAEQVVRSEQVELLQQAAGGTDGALWVEWPMLSATQKDMVRVIRRWDRGKAPGVASLASPAPGGHLSRAALVDQPVLHDAMIDNLPPSTPRTVFNVATVRQLDLYAQVKQTAATSATARGAS
jgi:hypothetical protein